MCCVRLECFLYNLLQRRHRKSFLFLLYRPLRRPFIEPIDAKIQNNAAQLTSVFCSLHNIKLLLLTFTFWPVLKFTSMYLIGIKTSKPVTQRWRWHINTQKIPEDSNETLKAFFFCVSRYILNILDFFISVIEDCVFIVVLNYTNGNTKPTSKLIS